MLFYTISAGVFSYSSPFLRVPYREEPRKTGPESSVPFALLRTTYPLPYYLGVRNTRYIILIALLTLNSTAARADTILYTIGGTLPTGAVTELDSNFNIIGQSSIPVTPGTSPGAYYTLQFSLSSPFTPAASGSDYSVFNTVLTYRLNGWIVSSAPASMVFFTNASGGFLAPEYALSIGQDLLSWSWAGPQLFTRTPASPTPSHGIYFSDGDSHDYSTLQFVGVNNLLWELPDNTFVTVIDTPQPLGATALPTPEPAPQSFLILAAILRLALRALKPTAA